MTSEKRPKRWIWILAPITLLGIGAALVFGSTDDPYSALRDLHPRETVQVWNVSGRTNAVRNFFFTQSKAEVDRAVAKLTAPGKPDGITLVLSTTTPNAPRIPPRHGRFGFVRSQGLGGERTVFTVYENEIPKGVDFLAGIMHKLGFS